MFLRALAVAVCVALAGCAPSASDGPPIVLITIDTLRADRLGSYGYFRNTSPRIDALAAESIRFERAVTPMSMTLPAHLSLFTSVDPATHRVLGNFIVIEPPRRGELQTLAQALRSQGYRTAAFVSAAPLKRFTGIDAGFEDFDEPTEIERRADATNAAVFAWLDQLPSPRGFFLWVHYYDPHVPYDPPEPHRSKYQPSDRQLDHLTELGFENPSSPVVLEANNFYDGEVRFVDTQVGELLGRLRTQLDWDELTLVLTSDHGEGLGQHRYFDHGTLHNEQLDVPLIVKLPSGIGPGPSTYPGLVSLLDVVPLLVNALSLEIEAAFANQLEGHDPLGRTPRRTAYAQRPNAPLPPPAGEGRGHALTTLDWKLHHDPDGDDALYDLRTDYAELQDVSEEVPTRAATLSDELHETLERPRPSPPLLRLRLLDDETLAPIRNERANEVEAELREQLKALGYLE